MAAMLVMRSHWAGQGGKWGGGVGLSHIPLIVGLNIPYPANSSSKNWNFVTVFYISAISRYEDNTINNKCSERKVERAKTYPSV